MTLLMNSSWKCVSKIKKKAMKDRKAAQATWSSCQNEEEEEGLNQKMNSQCYLFKVEWISDRNSKSLNPTKKNTLKKIDSI